MARNNISDHHKDQLLDVVFHHMGQGLRRRVMLEVPEAYNAYCGRRVVDVVRGDSAAGRRLRPHVGGAMTETRQERRWARLEQLVDEHGMASEQREDYHRGEQSDMQWQTLGRYALIEADEGSADNGGPWWSHSDDWRALLNDSACQEYPDDWPAERLFDLDSDWETAVELRLAYEPEVEPPSDGSEAVSRDDLVEAHALGLHDDVPREGRQLVGEVDTKVDNPNQAEGMVD